MVTPAVKEIVKKSTCNKRTVTELPFLFHDGRNGSKMSRNNLDWWQKEMDKRRGRRKIAKASRRANRK